MRLETSISTPRHRDVMDQTPEVLKSIDDFFCLDHSTTVNISSFRYEMPGGVAAIDCYLAMLFDNRVRIQT